MLDAPKGKLHTDVRALEPGKRIAFRVNGLFGEPLSDNCAA